MLGRSVGVAATCALSASALILPPGIAPASNTPELSLNAVNPKNQILTLPCAECAFPPTSNNDVEGVEQEEEPEFWIQGGANSLLLNFTISEDERRLQFNGADIYPPRMFRAGHSQLHRIFVKQIPSNTEEAQIRSGDVRSADLEVTMYGVLESERHALTPDGDELVPLHLQILALEDEPMKLDEVQVDLLRTSEDELLIMQVRNRVPDERPLLPGPHSKEEMAAMYPSHHPHGPPFGPPDAKHKECDVLPASLCKLKNIIESKIDAAMGPGPRRGGCRGRKGHGPPDRLPTHIKPGFLRPGPDGEEGPHPHHHGRPHHMRPHGPHHGHHRGHFWRHHFLRAFAKGLVAVLIPVFAGITVGMSVSLVGLVVGRLISFLWIKLVRRGRRGYASVALNEAAAEEVEHKAGLAETEAPPPVYEDAPAYEEVQKDVK